MRFFYGLNHCEFIIFFQKKCFKNQVEKVPSVFLLKN
jgi:hypothetical protein